MKFYLKFYLGFALRKRVTPCIRWKFLYDRYLIGVTRDQMFGKRGKEARSCTQSCLTSLDEAQWTVSNAGSHIRSLIRLHGRAYTSYYYVAVMYRCCSIVKQGESNDRKHESKAKGTEVSQESRNDLVSSNSCGPCSLSDYFRSLLLRHLPYMLYTTWKRTFSPAKAKRN